MRNQEGSIIDDSWPSIEKEPTEAAAPAPAARALKALISAGPPGNDWDGLFGRLTPAEIEGLRSLVPYMPRKAVQHFADRLCAAN